MKKKWGEFGKNMYLSKRKHPNTIDEIDREHA